MEASERSVGREDEQFPEDADKVLSAITKSTYPTENQLVKETGLSTGRFRKAIKRLEDSRLIREQVGGFHGTMFKLVSSEPGALADKPKTRGDSPKTLELMAKAKKLYEAKEAYADIAKKLGITEARATYLCAKLIKRGEVERRYNRSGSKAAPSGGPPSPMTMVLSENPNRDDEKDDQDDEPEVLEQVPITSPKKVSWSDPRTGEKHTGFMVYTDELTQDELVEIYREMKDRIPTVPIFDSWVQIVKNEGMPIREDRVRFISFDLRMVV
jgi:DNA-binding MarR family transcriptional regulator